MIASTMRRFLPDDLITPLKVLGKYDWLRLYQFGAKPSPGTKFRVSLFTTSCASMHSQLAMASRFAFTSRNRP
jgi:hypothetical protein